jgi:hypothetical protein
VGRSISEFVLALEVMKEAALRQTRDGANVINRGRRIALRANDHQSRVEEFRFRILPDLHHHHVHTDWLVCYWIVSKSQHRARVFL